MQKRSRSGIGVAIILLGLFYPKIKANIPNIISSEPSVRDFLVIQKPTPELISTASKLDDIVTDNTDKDKLAVYTYEFSTRVPRYNTKSQNVVNILTAAAKDLFGDSLKTKYNSQIGQLLTEQTQEITGPYDRVINNEIMAQLSGLHNAYAWVLGGEDDNQ